MSAHQKLGPQPSSVGIWRAHSSFLSLPLHLHLQCHPLVVHWWQASGAVNLMAKSGGIMAVVYHLVAMFSWYGGACVFVCVCEEDRLLWGRWEHCQWCGEKNKTLNKKQTRATVRVYGESQCSITMQITASQFSVVSMLPPIKQTYMHMHKFENEMKWCFS